MLLAYPKLIFLIIPLFFILLFIILKDFVKIDYDLKQNKSFMRSRRAYKFFMFITRFIIFSLIIILFARPYIEIETKESGNPKLTVLIDNSSSMDIYDLSFLNGLIKRIEREIPVNVKYISSDRLTSNLGDEALKYLEEDMNLLFVSDFQVTNGISLLDLALYSNTLNASISALELSTNKKDLSVSIEGENKVISNQEAVFYIKINKLNLDEYNLVVTVDNQPVLNIRDRAEKIEFRQKFESGTHKIVAKILGDDDIPENNVFYKVVDVVPKPKILYVTTQNSKLPSILSQFYDVEVQQSIPSNISKYYALIIEDMPAGKISNVKTLAKYAEEGNGILVIGGMNSFDRGYYKSSEFETLLPVRIGRGEKKQGDSNIVILIDMSGSTQNYWVKDEYGRAVEIKDSKPLDVIKALAVDVIETLNRGNRVGVVAFAIQDPNLKQSETSFKAVKITDIKPLSEIKEMAVDKISRINAKGQSLFDVGLAGAYSLLKYETGNRNVILITDGGLNVYKPVKDAGLRTVQKMAEEGIRTYTVGVGRKDDYGNLRVDEAYLKTMAEYGNGLYFSADETNRLKILFGTPEEKKQGDEMSLFILNPYHFITRNLNLDATMYGFNQVVPKSMARTLITTDSGEPALTEWRYGLGKVITITVFSGQAGLGQLLVGNNSRLITRTVNYLIGDPERKQDFVITIPDTRINEVAEIYVISKEYPKSDIPLIKTKENYYVGKSKVNTTGFNTLLGKDFAVNYPKEFEILGMNKNVNALVSSTGGKVFRQTDAEQIINHIKTISKRTKIKKEYIVWPILLAIALLYIFEIAIRKILENRKLI